MEKSFSVKRIAILGAGVMGAQIAAHCVNAGYQTKLFDLASDGENKNKIVTGAVARLKKLKPQPLADLNLVKQVACFNFSDDLGELNDCDLIIEAVSERLDIKESLYADIAPHINKNAILASNTSGISINTLASFLPKEMLSRFCGVHFFNPPRYMHLLELIPCDVTDKRLLNELETFFVHGLGKGVVIAKDTPNFIANRVGVFSLLVTISHAERFNLSLDTVDALTGVLLGRPKSATFRTMDVVGLDTMSHVVKTMADNCQDDPWHDLYTLPNWLNSLIADGALGQKSGRGIYRKNGRCIEVYDKSSDDYVETNAIVSDDVKAIFKEKNTKKRFELLKDSGHPEAQFLYHCFIDLFHYCAYHLRDIADNVSDIDNALCWGFGWNEGPFALWQGFGIEDGVALEKEICDEKTLTQAPLPSWFKDLQAFYKGEGFNPHSRSYVTSSALPIYERQWSMAADISKVIVDKKAYMLWSVDSKNLIISFKSSGNSVGEEVLQGLNHGLDLAESDYQSLIIWQESDMNFSLGANLKEFIELFSSDKQIELDSAIALFQQTASRLKYSSVPTIAALRGRALGGGLELIMHCDKVVASLESYVGLVEVGVGLLPAGGGLKHFAALASKKDTTEGAYAFLEKGFKSIATATVAASSLNAVRLGFLPADTRTVMNAKEILYVAHKTANYLNDIGYKPQVKSNISVMGLEACARLQLIITNMQAGGFISEHDALIANEIAFVITGGDLNEGEMVNDEWFLTLERKAFVRLAQTEKTRARVLHLLETGKPLRN